MSDVWQAARALVKNPGFAAVAILALAVGIGVNTAMFASADAIAFRPLNLTDEHSLVAISGLPRGKADPENIAPADYADWRRAARTVQDFAAYEWITANLTGEGEPERVQAFAVSDNFFRVMRARPLLGRTFGAERRVVLLSHALWLRRFGGDRTAVGREVRLNGAAHTVVGVMPDDFKFPLTAEVWIPREVTPADEASRAFFNLTGVGRLRPGVTVEEAHAEFDALSRRTAEAYPETHARRGVLVQPLKQFVVGRYSEGYTWMLLYASAFLMLIACANVAVLQFVRASGRARELAIRMALGAPRWRIVRHVLAETVIASAAASLLGLLIGSWFIDLDKSYMPAEVEKYLPGWRGMGINGWVLAYTAAFAALSGIMAGLLPALQSARGGVNEALKEGGRTSGGARRHRIRNLLVASEIALAIVLLTGAALMTKGVLAILNPLPNADPERVLTLRLALPDTRYPERAGLAIFYERLLARLPEAALVMNVPYGHPGWTQPLAIEGYTQARGEILTAHLQCASENYFRVLRVPVLEGREFTPGDGRDAPQVAVVSQAFARRHWPGRSALGRRVHIGAENEPWVTVVGVSADIRHDPIERAPHPEIFRPYRQAPPRMASLLLRDPQPLAAVAGVRAQVRALDRDLPVYEVKTLRTMINQTVTGFSYVAGMLAVLSVIALVLAAVGVYSVMAHTVVERTHEIGIRVALGARPADVVSMLASSGLGTAAVGAVVGIVMAFGFARLLAAFLVGVGANDPLALLAAPAVLVAAALAASWAPARRAARVDPVVALRGE